MEINYLEKTWEELDKRLELLPWQAAGLQQTASGYGAKLTTAWKVKHGDRWYRVYAVCFSNAGSSYIISKGQKLFIR